MRAAPALLLAAVLLAAPPALAQAPQYTYADAQNDNYFYSIGSLKALVMSSGMGVQMPVPMQDFQQMMQMTGLTAGPMNPFLTMAAYSSGTPAFTKAFNGNMFDFENYRWDPKTFDTTVTAEGQAVTAIKEIHWVIAFNNFSAPLDHFLALALSVQAAGKVNWANQMLKDPVTGLYRHAWKDGKVTDPSLKYSDNAAMLWALSDLAFISDGFPFSAVGKMFTPEQARAQADDFFLSLKAYADRNPGWTRTADARDSAKAVEALARYATTAANADLKRQATDFARSEADRLKAGIATDGQLPPGSRSPVATQGNAVNAFLRLWKLTGDASYRFAALRAWNYLEDRWDAGVGVYATTSGADRYSPGSGRYVYSVYDVGAVAGAVNALLHIEGALGDSAQQALKERYATFFNNALKKSGLQLAEDALAGGDGDNDGVPLFLTARKPDAQAHEATYFKTNGTWALTDPRFDTVDTMYAATEFVWLGAWPGGLIAVPGRGIVDVKPAPAAAPAAAASASTPSSAAAATPGTAAPPTSAPGTAAPATAAPTSSAATRAPRATPGFEMVLGLAGLAGAFVVAQRLRKR